MFTLCGLILEARENLFRNFWSPFSISFYFFSSERNNLKKTDRFSSVFAGLLDSVFLIDRFSSLFILASVRRFSFSRIKSAIFSDRDS